MLKMGKIDSLIERFIKIFVIIELISNKNQEYMSYYFSTVIQEKTFKQVIDLVKSELAKEGFGVPSEVDMQGTFKAKLGITFRKYKILGACNPAFALRAVESERNIGVLLPCSVVVQENDSGAVEVAAVDPLTSMMSVDNPVVQEVATEIGHRLERVIDRLKG
jgi:uncharacterized protein (DUF302 family)